MGNQRTWHICPSQSVTALYQPCLPLRCCWLLAWDSLLSTQSLSVWAQTMLRSQGHGCSLGPNLGHPASRPSTSSLHPAFRCGRGKVKVVHTFCQGLGFPSCLNLCSPGEMESNNKNSYQLYPFSWFRLTSI